MSEQQNFQIDGKFRALVQNTTDTIVISDESCSIIFCNKNISKFFGYTPSEVIGQPLTILLPEPIRETQKQEVFNLVFKKESIFLNKAVELPALRKDGSFFTMELSLSYWAENNRIYIAVIIRDISARKKVEEELQNERAFLQGILDNAEESIIGCDVNGILNFCNQAARKHLKIGTEPNALRNWVDRFSFFYEDGKTPLVYEDLPIFRALRGASVQNKEFIAVTRSGTRYILQANSKQIKDQNNRVKGAVCVITDLTESRGKSILLLRRNKQLLQSLKKLKEAQNLIKQTNNELELRVNYRTEELINKNTELNSMNEALQTVNTDLDNFLYIASHDLKVPLINMEALLKLLYLDTKGQNPMVTELIEKLQISVDRMKSTMRDISEVVQVQKQVGQNLERVNLPDLLTEITDSIAEQIRLTGTQIESDFIAVDNIRFSPINLKSILYNLITNGVKYRSPDRLPYLHISTEKLPGRVALRVKDNGLGIDLEKNGKKLFGMFSRLHNHVEGSGIGLYIIKRIIENSGGSIEVNSKLGEGSEFIVYFKDQD